MYNTLQSLGFFAGGAVGGWVTKTQGAAGLFLLCGGLMLAWLLVAWPMRAPGRYAAGPPPREARLCRAGQLNCDLFINSRAPLCRSAQENPSWHPLIKSSSSAIWAATPKCAAFPSGDQVANVTIATTDKWKDKQTGEMKEATEWHRVVFNGRLAEIVGQYLRKGSQVYVEGSLRTRKWTDKDGIEKYTTEIRADQMQMLGSRQGMGGPGGDDGGGGGYEAPRQSAPRARRRQPHRGRPPRPSKAASGFDDMDDDIPF